MSAENNIQLISYLAAAEIYNNSKNIYECFLPIVESALMCDNTKDTISFLGLQNKLLEIYHLNVPKTTLRKLLELMQEQGKIEFVARKNITPCKNELSTAFFSKRAEMENSIEDFFIALNTFLVDNGISIPMTDIKKECCSWLYDHSLELAYFINNGILKDNTEKSDWEYSPQLVSFLLDISEKKSAHFKTFLLLYNGAVQSSLLNFETNKINTVCESSLQLKHVILDTNFILRMLDLQSEFDCITANETIGMLKLQGTHFYILEQTLSEIQRSIRNFLDDSRSHMQYIKTFFSGKQIRMSGFLEAMKRGIDRTELLEKSKIESLKAKISELVDATFVEDFDDSKIDTAEIESLVLSKNKDGYSEKQARHDLSLIEYCRKKRKKKVSAVTDIEWWVLTNDERLTFWNQRRSNTYQECLTEIQLSNISWIQQKKTDNIGLMQTIMSLSNSTAISSSDIELFAQRIRSYHEKHKDHSSSFDKISLVFESNKITTADIQKINAEDDAFEQIIEEKMLEIQMEKLANQQEYETIKEKDKQLSDENIVLKDQLSSLSLQIKTVKYRHKIEKYEQDIQDAIKEINDLSSKKDIYDKINEYQKTINISTGRYTVLTIMLIFLPLVAIFVLYIKLVFPFMLSIFKNMDSMPNFAQNIICSWIIPIIFTAIYYLIVSVLFGNPLSHKELFVLLKQKLLKLRTRKYMKRNGIPLGYQTGDVNKKIMEMNSGVERVKRTIENLKGNIKEIEEEIEALHNSSK